MRFADFRGVDPIDLLKRSVRAFIKNNMLTYAAALAYHSLFALFPFLIFLIALLGFLRIPGFFNWLLAQAKSALPADTFQLVDGVIGDIQGRSQGGLLSIGIVLAIWSASAGIRSVMTAMNVAFGVQETRPTWKRYVLSALYTIGLAVLLIGVSALMLIGPRAVEWIAGQAGFGHDFVTLWTWLRWPVLIVLLIVVAALIYEVAPNTDEPFVLISPGAVLAVAVWVLVSYGFSLYVSHVADYSATYGSLGGIIVLLLYFYISSAVLLLGAEVNAELFRLEHKTPAH